MKKSIFVCVIGVILGVASTYYYLRSEYVFLSQNQLEYIESGQGIATPNAPNRVYTKREVCEKLAYDEGISMIDFDTGLLHAMRYEDVTPCWPFTTEEVVRREEYKSYLNKEIALLEKIKKQRIENVQLEAEHKELHLQVQEEIRKLRESDIDAYVIFSDILIIDKAPEEDEKLHNQLLKYPSAKKLYAVYDRTQIVEQLLEESTSDKYLSEQILFRQNFITQIMRNVMAE